MLLKITDVKNQTEQGKAMFMVLERPYCTESRSIYVVNALKSRCSENSSNSSFLHLEQIHDLEMSNEKGKGEMNRDKKESRKGEMVKTLEVIYNRPEGKVYLPCIPHGFELRTVLPVPLPQDTCGGMHQESTRPVISSYTDAVCF